MKKQITRDRLITALNRKRPPRVEAEWDLCTKVIRSFATLGLKSAISQACGREQSEIDAAKVSLSRNYYGVHTEEDVDRYLDILKKHSGRKRRFRDRIKAVQEHHNISGLERGMIELDYAKTETWVDMETLPLIESDKPRMIARKYDAVDLLAENVKNCPSSLKTYEWNEGEWEPSDLTKVEIEATYHENIWANVYDIKLNDTIYECHIQFGQDLFIDDPRGRWFCAATGKPSF